MKVSYHHSFLHDPKNPAVRYAWNPEAFLRAYVANAPVALKRSLVRDSGESLYLFSGRGGRPNAFLFVMSKDQDFIRKINSEAISQEDIRDTLERDEQIGFASFVLIDGNRYGLGGVMGGPRHIPFGEFINALLTNIGVGLRYESMAIMEKITMEQVRRFAYLGPVSFKYCTRGEIGAALMRLAGGDPTEHGGHIELRITPGRGRDQSSQVMPLLETVSANGEAMRIHVAGKYDADEELIESYLDIGGRVSREIRTHAVSEAEIFASMHQSANDVRVQLDADIAVMTNGIRYEPRHQDLDRIRDFDRADSWIAIGARG